MSAHRRLVLLLWTPPALVLEFYKTSLYCFVLDELRDILQPGARRADQMLSPTGATRRTHQRQRSLPFPSDSAGPEESSPGRYDDLCRPPTVCRRTMTSKLFVVMPWHWTDGGGGPGGHV